MLPNVHSKINTEKVTLYNTQNRILNEHCTLPVQYADSVELKGGLLNNRVCTVKFRVVESYFLLSLLKDALGHQPQWT